MSGRRARRKGMVAEYSVRDYFRQLGWEADRVPASGAAQGFKGDVRIRKDGVEKFIEVKSRHSEYKTIYELLTKYVSRDVVGLIHLDNPPFIVATTYTDMQEIHEKLYQPLTHVKKGLKKLIGMQKLVKDCDFLVVKDNNKPFIFIRYL